MRKKPESLSALQQLGSSWELAEELLLVMEKFVYEAYGSKYDEVNETRYELFHKKYSKQNKLIDLALLPPYKSVLGKRLQRANYVSRLWKCCGIANKDYPPQGQHDGHGVRDQLV